MKVGPKILGKGLLISVLALLVISGNANAQTTAPPAKKSASQAKHAASQPVPELEPKAIELLKATSARLAAAHTISFTAVETFESQSRHGHPLIFASNSEITVQRPISYR